MNCIKHEMENNYIVEIKGSKLDNSNSVEFKKELELFNKSDLASLIVDLSKVDYINSAIVGILFNMVNNLSYQNRILKVVTDNNHLLQVFDFTSFNSIAKIFPSMEEAIKYQKLNF